MTARTFHKVTSCIFAFQEAGKAVIRGFLEPLALRGVTQHIHWNKWVELSRFMPKTGFVPKES
jgi:hypothetical protein